MTNCSHTGKCSSEGIKCSSCNHNVDAKKDHYTPINIWNPPYYPYNGDWYVTCGTDTTNVTKY